LSDRSFRISFAASLVLIVAAPAIANTLYVTNGSFETTTNGNGQLGYNTNATGWTTTGYNFIFAPGTADVVGDTTGSAGSLALWGPNDGSNNGLPGTSPDGGNFVAADPVYNQGPIYQTINGLTIGQTYVLGFYWGGAQQYSFTGPTTEGWDVTLGSVTQDTVALSNVNHGFTGWYYQTFNYVATSASETLSFMAVGTPNGLPPFALLDGVSLQAAPEPGTLALIGLGLLAIPIGSRLRGRRH